MRCVARCCVTHDHATDRRHEPPASHVRLVEGISEPGARDGKYLKDFGKHYLTIDEDVARKNLTEFTHGHFYRGWIPTRFNEIADRRFCLVHLDVDLYDPTLDTLKFFYPRMSPGGLMICDDSGLSKCPGARLAMEEFFANPSEPLIDLPNRQQFVDRAPPQLDDAGTSCCVGEASSMSADSTRGEYELVIRPQAIVSLTGHRRVSRATASCCGRSHPRRARPLQAGRVRRGVGGAAASACRWASPRSCSSDRRHSARRAGRIPTVLLRRRRDRSLFATGLRPASNTLVESANVIRKVYFPRIVVPLASVLVAAVDWVIGMVLVAVTYPVRRDRHRRCCSFPCSRCSRR